MAVSISRRPAEVEGRVSVSHRIASAAFRVAGLFAAVAVVWAVFILVGGGSWWGPVHSFLAGTVLFAIAGWQSVAVAAIAVWVADFAGRLARMEWRGE